MVNGSAPERDMRVNLSGLLLDNPIIPASGTYGFGGEYLRFYNPNMLGSFAIKGTTYEERFGNDLPRVAECKAGMLNSVGLQNPGIEKVISKELPLIKKFFKKPVVANISGFSKEEYVRCCQLVDGADNVGIIEVNISCPNVKAGGMSFGTSPESAAEITKAVKAVTVKPVFVKLSPNVTDIAAIAKACEDAGADGISLINTLLGMKIDIRKKKPVLANKMGGYSGPGIFPIAVRMVYQVYESVKIPIMGMGGVSNAADVLEMMMAGATAVQVGSANLVDPYACKNIIEELPLLMERLGIERLEDIIGAAHG